MDYFTEFIRALPDAPKGVWSDGDEILCMSAEAAYAIADLLEALYRAAGKDCTVLTGYYDPEEDARMDEDDILTGYHYVRMD